MTLLQLKPGPFAEQLTPLVVEQLLSSLHPHREFDQLSLLIARIDGSVRFLVRTPDALADTVKSHLFAAYADLHIQDVSDDTLVPKSRQTRRDRYFWLRRTGAMPIKRHPQLLDAANRQVVDPLDGVMATLRTPQDDKLTLMVEIKLAPLADAYRYRATTGLLRLRGREFQRAQWFTDRYVWVGLRPWYLRGTVLAPLFPLLRSAIPKPVDEGRLNQRADETSPTHAGESDLQACMSKLEKHLFSAKVRLTAYAPHTKLAEAHLHSLASSFGQFDLPRLNGFQPCNKRKTCVLSTEEIATMWHLPQAQRSDADVDRQQFTQLPPPRMLPNVESSSEATALGEVAYRQIEHQVGLPVENRRRHVWAIGRTGMGKSTLLENMILSDIVAGRGVGVLDPHGDLIDSLLQKLPYSRRLDVVLVDPTDEQFPLAFNPLDCSDTPPRRVADELLSLLKKLFATGPHGSWGPQLEDIAHNTLLTLAYAGDTTLLDALRLLSEERFREELLARVDDSLVLAWWETRFPALMARRSDDPFGSFLNKLGQLLTDPLLRNMLGQTRSKLRLREAMDEGKIVLCNLSKGKLGGRASAFLGGLLVTQFQLAAMSRADIPESRRRDFMLYVDEFQNYASASFVDMLSEARKYRLCLTLANQFAEGQLPKEMIQALCGNVGTLISFQVGANDAELLVQQLGGGLTVQDFLSLPRFQCYVRTEVAGETTPPFSVRTLPPPEIEIEEELRCLHPGVHPWKLVRRKVQRVKRHSAKTYATRRQAVESVLADRMARLPHR